MFAHVEHEVEEAFASGFPLVPQSECICEGVRVCCMRECVC